MKTVAVFCLGIVIGVLVFVAGRAVLPGAHVTAPAVPVASKSGTSTMSESATRGAASSSSSGGHSSGPVITIDSITKTDASASFDKSAFVSSSPNPTITGQANVAQVSIIINDGSGTGLVGSAVPVRDGHWSYRSPLALAPGTYAVLLGGAGATKSATLTVTK